MDKIIATRSEKAVSYSLYHGFANDHYCLFYCKGFDTLEEILDIFYSHESDYGKVITVSDPFAAPFNDTYRSMVKKWMQENEIGNPGLSGYLIKTSPGRILFMEYDFMLDLPTTNYTLAKEDRKSIYFTNTTADINSVYERAISSDSYRPFSIGTSMVCNYQSHIKDIFTCISPSENIVARKYTFVFSEANLPFIEELYFEYLNTLYFEGRTDCYLISHDKLYKIVEQNGENNSFSSITLKYVNPNIINYF